MGVIAAAQPLRHPCLEFLFGERTTRLDVFEPAQNLLMHVNVILNVLQGCIVGKAIKKASDSLLGWKHGSVPSCLSVFPVHGFCL
jgi:hypothetical protein